MHHALTWYLGSLVAIAELTRALVLGSWMSIGVLVLAFTPYCKDDMLVFMFNLADIEENHYRGRYGAV